MQQLEIPGFIERIVANPAVRNRACEQLAGIVADGDYTVELTDVDDTQYLVVQGPGYPDEVTALLSHPRVPITAGFAYEDTRTGEMRHFLEVEA